MKFVLKNKKIFNILLDIIMAVFLILSYYRKIVGYQYHEILGITFPILCIVHIAINYKWCIATIKMAFSKTSKLNVKLRFIVNVLLFISVFLCTLSGILRSRRILTGISSSNPIWKVIHKYSALYSLILTGVHALLHLDFIKAVLFKRKK